MNRPKLSDVCSVSPETLPAQKNSCASTGDGKGGSGGDDIKIKVTQLETDIEYIKRDTSEIKPDVKAIDSRLIKIETGISAVKSTLKASSAVISLVFALCACIFGSYVSKILDALNGLVLR